MNRSASLVALVLVLSSMAACSQAATAPESASPSPAATTPATPALSSATPIPSAETTPVPSASPDDAALVLGPDGSGPYIVGASMSELLAQNLISSVGASFHCDDSWQHADATGRYEGRLSVTFHLGSLIHLASDSADLVTSEGARVGMSIGELEDVYGSRGTIIVGTMLNQAFVVREPDAALGLVFHLDDTNTEARAVNAGELETLEEFLVRGEGC